MSRDRTPADIRVTIDARTFLTAVISADIFLREFDADVRRRIESHELSWGVPLHLTIGPDRVLIEAEVGNDLAVTDGNDLGYPPQPMLLRYSVPASVSDSPIQDGRYPLWILPSSLLVEAFKRETAESKRSGLEFFRDNISGDVTLRCTSVANLKQEYVEESRRLEPDVAINSDRFYRDCEIAFKSGLVIECSFPGKRHRNRYCPVYGVEHRRLRWGDLELQPVHGPAVDFDKGLMLAAGYAGVGGSDGVLIDISAGRIIAPTKDGLFVFASAGSQALGDGTISAHASDVALARALGITPEQLRLRIRVEGEIAVGRAVEHGRLSPDVLTAVAIRDLDSDAMGRLASDLLRWATSQLPVANLAPQGLAGGRHNERRAARAVHVIYEIAEQCAAAVDAGHVTLGFALEAWALRVGRIRVEMEAIRDQGMPVPLRTLVSSGRSAVISPRMMFVVAFSAFQVEGAEKPSEGLYVSIARKEIERRSRAVHIAAAAAAADLGRELREELVSPLAITLVAKARRDHASATALNALLAGVDQVGCQEVAARVMAWAHEKLPDADFATHVDRLTLSHEGDRIRAHIAAAIDLTDGDKAEEIDRILSRVIGRARVESEVRAQLTSAHPDDTPGEIHVDGGDFAAAYFALVGKRSEFELDVRRTLDAFDSIYGVPQHPLDRARRAMTATTPTELAQQAPWAAWAELFLEELRKNDVAGENLSLVEAVRCSWARDLHSVMKGAGTEAETVLGISSEFDPREPRHVDVLGPALTATILPNARTLDFSNAPYIYLHAAGREDRKYFRISEKACRAATNGRLAVDSTGRVVFSVTSPDGRWGVSIADRAAEPRPEAFRERNGLTDEQLAAVLEGSRDLARCIVPATDLVRIAARVADIADPRRGRSMRAVVTVRWAGSESRATEPEVGARVVDHTRTVEGYPVPGTRRPDPDAVGGHLRFYVFGDEGREVIDVPIVKALAVNIPDRIRIGHSSPEFEDVGRILAHRSVLAAVIDARWFHDAAGLVVESAIKEVHAAFTSDGALVLRDESSRVAVRLPLADRRLITDDDYLSIEMLTRGAVREWGGGAEQGLEVVVRTDTEERACAERSGAISFDPRARDPEIYAANEGMERDALSSEF